MKNGPDTSSGAPMGRADGFFSVRIIFMKAARLNGRYIDER